MPVPLQHLHDLRRQSGTCDKKALIQYGALGHKVRINAAKVGRVSHNACLPRPLSMGTSPQSFESLENHHHSQTARLQRLQQQIPDCARHSGSITRSTFRQLTRTVVNAPLPSRTPRPAVYCFRHHGQRLFGPGRTAGTHARATKQQTVACTASGPPKPDARVTTADHV